MNKWFIAGILGILAIVIGAFIGSASLNTVSQERLTASIQSTKKQQGEAVIDSSSNDPISLLFVGDIMLSRFIQTQIERHENDYKFPFELSSDVVRSADMAFGNLEGPISNRGKNQGSMYSFRAAPRVIEGLLSAGFDVLSLANNHIFDWGTDAFIDTLSILKENGIIPIGAGRNIQEANECAFFVAKGTTICFLAFTNLYPLSLSATSNKPGISVFDIEKITAYIADIKKQKKADIVIVSLHWGDEYQNTSNASQQKNAHELAVAGADIIVGHHPHVPQEVEEFENKNGHKGVIAYSLGNFIFDQGFSKETMNGLVMRVVLKDKHIDQIYYGTAAMNAYFQPDIIWKE